MTSRLKAAFLSISTLIILFASSGCGPAQKNLSHLPARELFTQAKEKYDKHKYVSAIELFQSVVYNYPGETIIDTAQYYLALAYFGNEEYALAGTEFNRYLINYPTSAYAANAQFMKAVSAFEDTPKSSGLDQTELDDVIRQLKDFITDHPESEVLPDAKKYLAAAQDRLAEKCYNGGITYSRMGASDAAKIYFQKVIDDFTDSKYAPMASFNIAMEEMHLKHYDEARKRFETFVTVFPKNPLAAKAALEARKAALKGAEAIYEKGDMKGAGDKFEALVKDFPDTGEARKAGSYLQKIREQLPDTSKTGNAKT